MTVEKLITDNIDTWTSALQTRSTAGRGSSGKIDLYGIKKLRELILELAVRGKLVPQDPNDEPASELLKRIAAEKAELVKQGKIKKQKPLPEISEEEKPFELPEGWEWVTLAAVGEIVGGGTPKSDNLQYWTKEGLKWLTPSDLYGLKGKYISTGARDITVEGLASSSARMMPKGAVLFSSRAPIGYVAIAGADLSTNQGFKSCVPYIKESSEYIYYFLLSAAKKIDAEASGTTFKEVSGAVVSKILMPLPPLNEQLKIVARADELISLCDQLEQHSLTTLNAHQQLVETLLATLTDSQSAAELADNWARISEHFDTLFTTEASIEALKQTILQLAVMGKLVPQDPNDEPASELLKRIAQEKEQLIKDGKIKKQKPLSPIPISDDEKPFELPKGWEWARLSELIIEDTQNGLSKKANDDKNGVPLLRISSATTRSDFIINEKEFKLTSDYSAAQLMGYALRKGDLLAVRFNGNKDFVGRIALFSGSTKGPVLYPDKLIRIRLPAQLIDPLLVRLMFNSKTIRVLIEKYCATTVGNWGISAKNLKAVLMPVPPVKEQQRILRTIHDLFIICDNLFVTLKTLQQTQLHLADALTDAAIN